VTLHHDVMFQKIFWRTFILFMIGWWWSLSKWNTFIFNLNVYNVNHRSHWRSA